MKKSTVGQFIFVFSNLWLPSFLVFLMWFLFWFKLKFKVDFSDFGILPRTITGLKGILFSPFLHSDVFHLINNSGPIVLLMAALHYFYRNIFYQVVGCGWVLSGLLTWLIGRDSYHIGASGIIYVLATFIFFSGLRSSYYRLVALSFVIVLLYGGLIWFVFPGVQEGVSWEAHLSGFFVGMALSFLNVKSFRKEIILYDWQDPNYDSSQDKFMQRFDENGNFVNLLVQNIDVEANQQKAYFSMDKNVNYTFLINRKEPD